MQVTLFLFRNAFASIGASLLIVCLYAWAQRELVFGTIAGQIWFGFGIALNLVRMGHYTLYVKDGSRWGPMVWLNSYRILTLLSGTVYGSLLFIFFQNASPSLQVLTMFIVVGLPAAAVGTHSADKVTFRAFLYTITVPAIIFLFAYAGPDFRLIGFLIILFTAVMDRSANRTTTSLLENIEMTFAMSYRATHDPLVGLFNREELEHQFELRAPRSNRAIAMMFVDLDNFKPLNDTLGHQAGDKALIEVADIIKHAIRSDDIAARLGGDEFVVIMFLNSESEVRAIANTVLQKIQAMTFEGEYEGLSASVGISFHPNTEVSFSRLMRIADLACYESKEAGKNCVTMLNYASNVKAFSQTKSG